MLQTLHLPSRHDNPFATCWTRPGAMEFRFSEGDSAELLIEKLREHDWFGAIVGPHGSGKSTLLETLKPRLIAAGRHVYQITLTSGQRQVPYMELPASWTDALAQTKEKPVSTGPSCNSFVLFIDGYEQLGWLARWQLKRRCRRAGIGLVVTSHRPTRLPTLIELAPDRRLVEQLVAQLCANAPVEILPADIAASHACHGSNLREVFFDLYDRYERRRRASRTGATASS